MDAKEQLIREKGLLLRKIAESAQRGQLQEVLASGEKLHWALRQGIWHILAL